MASTACDPRICSHIEAAASCTMSASASRPCAGRTPARLMALLDNCSACGLMPRPWHILAVRRGSPAFPPRTQNVWCPGPTENGPKLHAPLTNAELHARYRESLEALERAAPQHGQTRRSGSGRAGLLRREAPSCLRTAALPSGVQEEEQRLNRSRRTVPPALTQAPHECACEIESSGTGHASHDGRKLSWGLPVAVRKLCLLGSSGTGSGRATLRLHGPLWSGDRHLVSAATVEESRLQ